jgi:hypothetical protein
VDPWAKISVDKGLFPDESPANFSAPSTRRRRCRRHELGRKGFSLQNSAHVIHFHFVSFLLL